MKRVLLFLVVLLAAGSLGAYAQNITVTGRVLDERNEGLPGAGVGVRNSASTGTATDAQGNFTLSVPAGTTLVIQSVGYRTEEVAATSALTVKLQLAAKELNGTVVTALAIRREKRELGYSSTTLNNQELTAGNNVSALSSLQGKVSGANITSSTGGPGGSTRIVLRGEKSIAGGNNALIVVDGIIINNASRLEGVSELSQIDFGNQGNDINPDDIESITVLKGPAAAALYGSVGANGAVIITTKTGRNRGGGKRKTDISFTTKYTLSDVLKYPDFQNSYGQGNIYAGISDDHRENFSWGLPFDGQVRPWGQVINGQQLVKPYSAEKDNVKSFFNIGKTWENNVSLGGGGDNSSFYLSLGALNNTGIIPNTFYDKYSVRFNGSTNFSNKFYATVNFNYVNINSRVETSGQSANGQGAVWDNLLQTPRDIPIWEASNTKNPFFGYGIVDSTGVQRYGYYGAYALNPYFVADKFDNRNQTDRIISAATVGYKPNDHWNIYNRVAIDVLSDRTTIKIPAYNYLPFDVGYYSDPSGNPQIQTNNGGYTQSDANNLQFNNDLIASYSKEVSDDIGVDVTLGNNVRLLRSSFIFGSIDPVTNGLVIPDFYSLANGKSPNINPVNAFTNSAIIGAYGDIRLNYRRQVFLELTSRNDWSSTLAVGNRSYFYPSTNLSWIFTETFKNNFTRKILTFGKLRGGYASVGNSAQPYQNNNAAYQVAAVSSGFGSVTFPFNSVNGSVPAYSLGNAIGNPGLRPERTNAYEAGVDLGFFKDRLSIEATYYSNHTIDQILTVPVAPSTGYTGQVVNVGDVSNKGIELAARITPIAQRSGFRWDLFGTYTRNVSLVERLNSGTNQINLGGSSNMSVTATVGQPYGEFYGVDIAKDPQGHVIVDSASGLPQLATNSVNKGSYQPRFIASWGTNFTYKGFTLSVTFFTKQGGVFYSETKGLMDFTGTAAETGNRDLQVFPNSVYKNSAGQYVTNSTKYSPYDYYTNVIPAGQNIIDASYIKLQEASLYYTLPKGLIGRTFFGDARIGVYGNNLFIWTASDNKYVDPEVTTGGATNLQGYDFRARQSLRNYGISLRLTF